MSYKPYNLNPKKKTNPEILNLKPYMYIHECFGKDFRPRACPAPATSELFGTLLKGSGFREVGFQVSSSGLGEVRFLGSGFRVSGNFG